MARETSSPGLSPEDREFMQPDFSFGLNSEQLATVYDGEAPLKSTGALLGEDVAHIRRDLGLEKPPPPKTHLEQLLEERKPVQAPAFIDRFLSLTQFHEHDPHMRIHPNLADRFMTLVRHLPGGRESYSGKLEKEERKRRESASWGEDVIPTKNGENRVTDYIMRLDFFQGSLGIIAGKKFNRAAESAIENNTPIIGFYPSAGVRQHENYAGLQEMPNIVFDINRFKKRTKELLISVLVGEVWGGISASAVPLGHVRVGVEGTNYGFTGPRVIETYSRKAVPAGAQSIEAHTIYRNNDVLVKTPEDLVRFCGGILSVGESGNKRRRFSPISPKGISNVSHISQDARFRSFQKGFSTFFEDNPKEAFTEEPDASERKSVREKSLDDRIHDLIRDSGRPDTEFLLRSCFEDVVPLYSKYKLEDGSLEYPAIIAGLGRIGEQYFLVVGNQPSYKVDERYVSKKPSSPSPADFKYLRRMLVLGGRLGLPLISFIDTPGADPNLESEVQGIHDEIAYAINDLNEYKYPTISIVTGMLGSGGGMGLNPTFGHVAALSEAALTVAFPEAVASIIYNKVDPSQEQISQTTESLGLQPHRQVDLSLIDGIIPEPEGGAGVDPMKTAQSIQEYIVRIFNKEYTGRKDFNHLKQLKNLFRRRTLSRIITHS